MSRRRTLIGIGSGVALGSIATAVIDGRADASIRLLATSVSMGALLAFGCILWFWRKRTRQTSAVPSPIQRLRHHPEFLVAYHSLTDSLLTMAGQRDEILHDGTVVRLAHIQEEMRALAEGKLVFTGTEAWRTTYERILRAPGLDRYLSVAWLRSEDYWRDAPGRHSMQLNYDLIELGVRIERILILNDFFWPEGAILPARSICQWIEPQFKRGIVLRLVRESQIADETELLCDIGIYGERATGRLDLDDQCRTVRFTLDFTPQNGRLFSERWQRLLLFSVSFRELLDRRAGGR